MVIFYFYFIEKNGIDNKVEIWYSSIVNKGGWKSEENIYSKENKFTKMQQYKWILGSNKNGKDKTLSWH